MKEEEKSLKELGRGILSDSLKTKNTNAEGKWGVMDCRK